MSKCGSVAQTVGTIVLLALVAVPIWRGQQIQLTGSDGHQGLRDDDQRLSSRQLFKQSPSYTRWIQSLQRLAKARVELVEAAAEPDVAQVNQAAAIYRSRIMAVRDQTDYVIERLGLESGVAMLQDLAGPGAFDLLPDSVREVMQRDELSW